MEAKLASQELESDCLTCNWPVGPDSLSIQNDENSTISDVLRKHFWFTEVDFQGAMVCRTCWDQVNQFHQFYISVEKLCHNRLSSMIIKSEPTVIENEVSVSEATIQEQEYCSQVKEEPPLDINDEFELNDDAMNDQVKVQHMLKHRWSVEQRSKSAALLEDNYIRGHVEYICEYCGEDSLSFEMHLSHLFKEHGVIAGFVECCGKRYTNRKQLYQHVQVYNNPDIFRCEHCQKRFECKPELAAHMLKLHGIQNARNFMCGHCPRTFALPSHYRRHIKVHEVQELTVRQACTECPNTFSSIKALRDHFAAVHKGIRRFKCSFCEKTFYVSAKMKWHQQLKHQELLNIAGGR